MTTTQRLSPRAERSLDSADDALSQDDSSDISMEPDSLRKFYHEHCTYLPAMLGWFAFSALLTAYNKYVFGDGHMAFPCPLFLTSLHFLVQWTVSHCVCQYFPETMGRNSVSDLDWKTWALVSIPCGFVTALDVGLSNLSLAIITITFYTMVKSSAPVFVLAWAFVFRIEKITLRLIGVAAIIALGEFVTVAGEIDFVLKGFILCLIATCCSGARWTLVQLKLQNMQPPMKSSIATMRLLSPSMFFGMLVMSFAIEQPWNDFAQMDSNALLQVLLLGLGGGTIAIAMILCEFYLILEASAVIMMIGGVIKEMVTIMIGVSAFGDDLNATKIIGMCIVFSGVIVYKISFHREKQEEEADGIYQPIVQISEIEAEAEEMEEVRDSSARIT
ncbi:unnamed protein product [Cylindrotheca closterium]|uniref:Sugar phosphate transporter domain-containing protein n=1 Tax=Cylindrotheca closterium TaxID=2856 RepID=A0AAD2JNH3_9STRA|nr:unnamed protein product [Cylindrotheca closterium]